MSGTLGSSRDWAVIAASLKPAEEGGVPARSRTGEPGRGYDGAVSRAMTKLGNLWVPDRRLVVPVPAMIRRAA